MNKSAAMRNTSGRGKAVPTPSTNAPRGQNAGQPQQTTQGRLQKPVSAVRPTVGTQQNRPPPPAASPQPPAGAQQKRPPAPAVNRLPVKNTQQNRGPLASVQNRQPTSYAQPLKQQPSSVASKASLTGGPPSRLGGPPVVKVETTPCRYCGRSFISDRLQKHEEICVKVSKKKRKQYDAVKHRGTEAESFIKPQGRGKGPVGGGGGKALTKQPSAMKNNWRKKHEDFIAAIRSAKQMQAHVKAGGSLKDLPPPPPSDYSDYVKCPHCGRSFNRQAAERHIPKCASYNFNKPKGPPQQTAKRK